MRSLLSNSAVSAIIREGATQKLQDVIVGGKSEGMQFMDDAIWGQLVSGTVSPLEAYMKAIDKHRFKPFLPADEANLALAAGAYRGAPRAQRFREAFSAPALVIGLSNASSKSAKLATQQLDPERTKRNSRLMPTAEFILVDISNSFTKIAFSSRHRLGRVSRLPTKQLTWKKLKRCVETSTGQACDRCLGRSLAQSGRLQNFFGTDLLGES